MRLGLIGSTGHWHTYAPALKTVPGIELVAVAAAGPEETIGAFDHAPGLTVETRRYDDPRKMLDSEKLDVVQVSARPDRIPVWTRACLERRLPVMAEKPLAMDIPTLGSLYRLSLDQNVMVVPMHTMRESAELAAVRQAVQEGLIGEPLVSFSQKSYKWGKSRPDFMRSRKTFPGISPFIGIHAYDWLHWILGDVFTEARGREGTTARPDFPACASQAAFVLTMRNAGQAALTLDFLRPEAAPTHGDEHLRIAGTKGVVETVLNDRKVTLITQDRPPQPVPLTPQPDIFTAFARALRGEGPAPMTRYDAFRITEISIKAQQAADTNRTVSLVDTPFRER